VDILSSFGVYIYRYTFPKTTAHLNKQTFIHHRHNLLSYSLRLLTLQIQATLDHPKLRFKDVFKSWIRQILPRKHAKHTFRSKELVSSDLIHCTRGITETIIEPLNTSGAGASRPKSLSHRIYMSVYSASSVDTELSEFSNPPARRYSVSNSQNMPKKLSVVRFGVQNSLLICFDAHNIQSEKEQCIHALRTHQVNTLVELRRIEKAFALLGTPDVSEPMTAACKREQNMWVMTETDLLIGSYYVDSHGLLTELRGLTKNYPFRYQNIPFFCRKSALTTKLNQFTLLRRSKESRLQ
jgi:hypothetical protein